MSTSMTNFLKEYCQVLIRSYSWIGDRKHIIQPKGGRRERGTRQAGVTTVVEMPAVTELLLGIGACSLNRHRYTHTHVRIYMYVFSTRAHTCMHMLSIDAHATCVLSLNYICMLITNPQDRQS